MNTETLKVLETKIDELLAQHGAACEERDRLRSELDKAQARAEQMAAQLHQVEKERAEVKARVERILSRLDGLGPG
jgi:chromosome segregation ATPase